MKYAKIVDGVAVQIQGYHEDGFIEVPNDTVAGMLDNGDDTFSAPVIPPTIPQMVSRFQARAALYNAGMLDSVEAVMADAATDRIMVMAWQDAATFNRNSPTIAAMAGVIGLTDTGLDDLFIAAAIIEA